MSEQDPNEVPEEEQEEPRTTIAQATITEGLSRVQRIAGEQNVSRSLESL